MTEGNESLAEAIAGCGSNFGQMMLRIERWIKEHPDPPELPDRCPNPACDGYGGVLRNGRLGRCPVCAARSRREAARGYAVSHHLPEHEIRSWRKAGPGKRLTPLGELASWWAGHRRFRGGALLIGGEPGCGKTAALHRLALSIIGEADVAVVFVTGSAALRAADFREGDPHLVRKQEGAPVLMLDDLLPPLGLRDWQAEVLSELLSTRYARRFDRLTVISSGLAPAELRRRLPSAVAARLLDGGWLQQIDLSGCPCLRGEGVPR